MYASSDRKKFARELLVPIIEEIIGKRKYVKALTDEEILRGLREVLEEISDETDAETVGC